MKKGFTLVEIMAVITVLALITVAVVPSIIKQVTDKKEEVNGTTLDLIYDAASLYTENDKATYKKEMGNVYCITLETLVKEGLLDKTVTNFKTGKAIPLNRFIKMSVNIYREFEYSLLEQDEKCIESSGTLLSEIAEVGDYVAYDAGVWEETKAIPTNISDFGGYTKGSNKGNSISTISLKGWRVLSIDKSKKVVSIVHAGSPEYYNHYNEQAISSLTKLNNRASIYLNNIYASSAHNLTTEEMTAIFGNTGTNPISDTLKAIGDYYWQGNPSFIQGVGTCQYCYLSEVTPDGVSYGKGNVGNNNMMYGIRPVIVLKENIKTSGKGVDIFNQEAWQLIKP